MNPVNQGHLPTCRPLDIECKEPIQSSLAPAVHPQIPTIVHLSEGAFNTLKNAAIPLAGADENMDDAVAKIAMDSFFTNSLRLVENAAQRSGVVQYSRPGTSVHGDTVLFVTMRRLEESEYDILQLKLYWPTSEQEHTLDLSHAPASPQASAARNSQRQAQPTSQELVNALLAGSALNRADHDERPVTPNSEAAGSSEITGSSYSYTSSREKKSDKGGHRRLSSPTRCRVAPYPLTSSTSATALAASTGAAMGRRREIKLDQQEHNDFLDRVEGHITIAHKHEIKEFLAYLERDERLLSSLLPDPHNEPSTLRPMRLEAAILEATTGKDSALTGGKIVAFNVACNFTMLSASELELDPVFPEHLCLMAGVAALVPVVEDRVPVAKFLCRLERKRKTFSELRKDSAALELELKPYFRIHKTRLSDLLNSAFDMHLEPLAYKEVPENPDHLKLLNELPLKIEAEARDCIRLFLFYLEKEPGNVRSFGGLKASADPSLIVNRLVVKHQLAMNTIFTLNQVYALLWRYESAAEIHNRSS